MSAITSPCPHAPALRLPAHAQCLVLDPAIGPTPRALALCALEDAVLVQAAGRMDFRPVSQLTPCAPPARVALLPRDSLGQDRPIADLLLVPRQEIALAQAMATPIPAAQLCLPAAADPDSAWVELAVEGAERLVIDGVALNLAAYDDDCDAPPDLAEIIALRAYAGGEEVALIAAEAMPSGAWLHFSVPARTAAVRLVSETFLADGDCRPLGVALLRLSLEEAEIALDNPGLVRGFYPLERHDDIAWRWTDGAALLLLPPRAQTQRLDVQITDWHVAMGG